MNSEFFDLRPTLRILGGIKNQNTWEGLFRKSLKIESTLKGNVPNTGLKLMDIRNIPIPYTGRWKPLGEGPD